MCHVSQLRGTVRECELILNRSGLQVELSKNFGLSENKWILPKVMIRENTEIDSSNGKTAPQQCLSVKSQTNTDGYVALASTHFAFRQEKRMKTRNAVNPDMSREISTMYRQHVPTGSRKSALF